MRVASILQTLENFNKAHASVYRKLYGFGSVGKSSSTLLILICICPFSDRRFNLLNSQAISPPTPTSVTLLTNGMLSHTTCGSHFLEFANAQFIPCTWSAVRE